MYRKFSADHIFTGHKILPAGNVLITDVAGTVIDLVAKEAAGDGVEIFKGLLTPGFINAHCHLELSHLKGVIPQHQGLVAFVQAVMSSRASYAEQKLQAMLDADTAMYNAGIVAVGDICNTT
ncbi:MAG: amidohydrolase, partial [Ferruginibacter sp.]